MKPIMFAGTLDGASRRKDKSISVRATSNFEMSTEDFSEIDRLLGTTGFFLWQANEIQADQIPDVPADEAFGKMSDSQYQRWILKKTHGYIQTDLTWPEWYHQQEALINGKLLERLQEVEAGL